MELSGARKRSKYQNKHVKFALLEEDIISIPQQRSKVSSTFNHPNQFNVLLSVQIRLDKNHLNSNKKLQGFPLKSDYSHRHPYQNYQEIPL
jgi:hypothetical protein